MTYRAFGSKLCSVCGARSPYVYWIKIVGRARRTKRCTRCLDELRISGVRWEHVD